MNKIEKIVIHHSASAFGNASEITIWHLRRGFKSIGYHFVILNGCLKDNQFINDLDGLIETGRPFDSDKFISGFEAGAHAKGFNLNSVGICLIGNDIFTEKQLLSLANLLHYIVDFLGYQPEIIGHRDLPGKKTDCPSFSVSQFMKDYFEETGEEEIDELVSKEDTPAGE